MPTLPDVLLAVLFGLAVTGAVLVATIVLLAVLSETLRQTTGWRPRVLRPLAARDRWPPAKPARADARRHA